MEILVSIMVAKSIGMKGAIMFQCDANNPPAFQGITLNNNIFFAKTNDQLALFFIIH